MSRQSPQFLTVLITIYSCTLVSSPSAQAQVACSAYDQQLIANYYQQAMPAAMQGNVGSYVQLTQQLYGSLSPACLQQLQSYQGGYGDNRGYGGHYPPSGGVPGGVIDHGDGGYSSGGVYCGPGGGCVGP